MSHVPHELSEEFPNEADRLHELRQSDSRAARLMDEYHEVNRALHRAESNVEPVAEAEEQRLRRVRMSLKDEIARLLREANAV
ncbi:MAG: DUF465 domain-containing protein [Rhodobacteraceae bacterium]|nr:DUF465 domain-containing protein [Paracoccaceae bacterium]